MIKILFYSNQLTDYLEIPFEHPFLILEISKEANVSVSLDSCHSTNTNTIF